MASGTGINVEGLRSVIRDLQALGVEVADLKEIFSAISRRAAGVMQAAAPVRSGDLRNAIRGNRAKNKAVVFAGNRRVEYAGPINYGWEARNIAPANFTASTDAVMAPEAERMLVDGLAELIARYDLN